MRDAIEFLRRSAEELRQLAASAPDISRQLRQLADELDATATELERRDGVSR
jgi:ABC-type transporter Mla subunit MlaD